MFSAVLVLSIGCVSIVGDLAGTSRDLGRGGLQVSLPLTFGHSDKESLELLKGLGDLLIVEYRV